tara:strand:+ start:397 stop:735 length:339 start_codon:yes stop_codon:yes gene_type:complete
MSAGVYDIAIDQGSDFGVEFQVKVDGVAKDLTNYSARSQIRKIQTSSDVSAAFTCVVSNAAEGKIQMSLPNADSNVIDAGDYRYDLEIFTAADAAVSRIVQGKVTVNAGTTR